MYRKHRFVQISFTIPLVVTSAWVDAGGDLYGGSRDRVECAHPQAAIKPDLLPILAARLNRLLKK